MPYEYVNESGTVLPDTSSELANVEGEYKSTFGEDLVVAPETPEGVLIAAETSSRVGIATNNALLANQINPNIAGGRFLDAIWALFGGERSPGTPSTFSVAVDVTGTPLTLIPGGSIASTAVGDDFASDGDVILDVNGDGTIGFSSVELGPIECLIGQLTTIVDGVIGWETVNNTVAATLGTNEQTDVSSRRERRLTLGRQGAGIAEAVFSRVQAVPGVRSLAMLENITDTGGAISGLFVDAHAIYVCVDGGTDLDVGTALLAAKNGGCNWTNGQAGATPILVVVVDPFSGQSYNVLFDRPEVLPVLYRVTITPSQVSNAQQVVTQAILDYANGLLDGEDGLVVGADVSPFEAAGAINTVEPRITVTNVEVTLQSVVNYQPTNIVLLSDEIATVEASSIIVNIV